MRRMANLTLAAMSQGKAVCIIYAVQQDTKSVLMSEFIHHVC